MFNVFFEKMRWPIIVIGVLFGLCFGLAVPYFIDGCVHGLYEGKINIATLLQVAVTLIVGGYFSFSLSKLNSEISAKNSNSRAMKDELMKYCTDSIEYIEKFGSLIDAHYLSITVGKEKSFFSFKRNSNAADMPTHIADEIRSLQKKSGSAISLILRILNRYQVIELNGNGGVNTSRQKGPKNFSKEISKICHNCDLLCKVYWGAITGFSVNTGFKGPSLLEPISRDQFIFVYAALPQRQNILDVLQDLRFEINSHTFH